MKKIVVIFAIALMLSPTLVTFDNISAEKKSEFFFSEKYEDGYRYNARGWIYLHIEGKPYDRGYQHGYLLSNEIVDHINRWSNVIHASPIYSGKYIDHESEKYEKLSNKWWNFCRSRINKIYWDRTPEEYKDEIKGIADGVKAQGVQVHGRNVDYIDILSINQMFEFMVRFENQKKGFHPLKSLFYQIKGFIPTGYNDISSFIKSFLDAPKVDHCNGFIATGDATTEGQIVAAQGIRCGGWWYPYYIAQRWNVVLDIAPSDGNRLTFSSCPGYIWSDANYYHNEQGIIIIDTTTNQGLWKDSGYSMVIRTRSAAQYSNTLDEALEYLMHKNDGLWTAAYLLGDTETGEIARLDLALYAYEIWRTKNGFYVSDNNAKSLAVRKESNGLGIKGELLRLIELPQGKMNHAYLTRRYIPAPRGSKMEELGEKYYGDIDLEVLKNIIMYTYPVCDKGSTDLKASDTQLIEQNSLWVYWGRMNGNTWNTSDLIKNFKGVVDVPSAGWTFISGIPEGHDYQLPNEEDQDPLFEEEIIWSFDFAKNLNGRNHLHANLVYDNDCLYAATLDGNLCALYAPSGIKIWNKTINVFNGEKYINVDDEILVIGWENKTSAFDKETGELLWDNEKVRYISSQPVFLKDKIIIGNRNGYVFSMDKETGKMDWYKKFSPQNTYLATDGKNIFITNSDKCYCFDPINGEIIWDFETDGLIVSSAKIVKNTVYFGSCDTKIYALDKKTGDLKWEQQTGWGIYTTPAFSSGTLYVTSMDHNLYALDGKTGEILWSFTGKAAIHSPPTVYGESVFFGCDDGRFYVINKTNGKLNWQYEPAFTINDDIYNYVTTAIVGNVVADDGRVFFSGNGKIYGFDAQTVAKEKIGSKDDLSKIFEENELLILLFILFIIIIIAICYILIKRSKKK